MLGLNERADLNSRSTLGIVPNSSPVPRPQPPGALMAEAQRSKRVQQQLMAHAKILGAFIAVMWLSQLVLYFWPGKPYEKLGIEPRTVTGLAHIPLAPFV